MQNIHLIGAEDVSRAGSQMARAAADMQSAASSISCSFEQHQRFLDDWLQRLEAVVERMGQTP